MSRHLQRIGEVMKQLLQALEADYGQEPTYRVLAWVFGEHFRQEPERLVVKGSSELSADSLQSPDDLEATYRCGREGAGARALPGGVYGARGGGGGQHPAAAPCHPGRV